MTLCLIVTSYFTLICTLAHITIAGDRRLAYDLGNFDFGGLTAVRERVQSWLFFLYISQDFGLLSVRFPEKIAIYTGGLYVDRKTTYATRSCGDYLRGGHDRFGQRLGKDRDVDSR